jgi:hypothetical protein
MELIESDFWHELSIAYTLAFTYRYFVIIALSSLDCELWHEFSIAYNFAYTYFVIIGLSSMNNDLRAFH